MKYQKQGAKKATKNKLLYTLEIVKLLLKQSKQLDLDYQVVLRETAHHVVMYCYLKERGHSQASRDEIMQKIFSTGL